MAKRYIPLAEWAEAHGVAISTARKAVVEGRLPARKLAERWFVVEETPDEPRRGRVFTLFTHAGGAGKTSLARDLGFELASRGKRVLLVDVDPQANLSAWLGHGDVEPRHTLLPLFEKGERPRILEVLPNLNLIPSHVEVARAEVVLSSRPHSIYALRGLLNSLREDYDVILVDSLPSLGSLAAAAALSGDGLVVPVELSAKGVQALSTVVAMSRDYARALSQMGLWQGKNFVVAVVPNQAEGTVRDREVLSLLEEILEDIPVLKPLVRRPAVYREAQVRMAPVQLVGGEEVARELRALGDAFQALMASDSVLAQTA